MERPVPLDREKLAKLLALSTSDNEHEALGCLRAANRMVKAENMTWADVLAGPEKSFRISITRTGEPQEDWVPPHLKDKVVIDLMFKSIYAQPRTTDGFWQWLDDVHQKYLTFGQLSQGQYQALRRCYNASLRKNAR